MIATRVETMIPITNANKIGILCCCRYQAMNKPNAPISACARLKILDPL